ncbi:MAG: hypothetical protein V8Q71_00610 [Bacilli bacterium]
MRVNTNNDSCIDEIDLMIKIEDGIIKDIKFEWRSMCYMYIINIDND